jgi:dihydroxyacetone kinase-like predicted kinase
MDIEAQIFLSAQNDSLVVARNSTVTQANRPYQVLKKTNATGEFTQTKIMVGELNQQYIQIISGAVIGDVLIFQ